VNMGNKDGWDTSGRSDWILVPFVLGVVVVGAIIAESTTAEWVTIAKVAIPIVAVIVGCAYAADAIQRRKQDGGPGERLG
jgi:hypothetical protein